MRWQTPQTEKTAEWRPSVRFWFQEEGTNPDVITLEKNVPLSSFFSIFVYCHLLCFHSELPFLVHQFPMAKSIRFKIYHTECVTNSGYFYYTFSVQQYYITFTENQNQIFAQYSFLFIFRSPNVSARFMGLLMESHATIFQIRIISCDYNSCLYND
jgi:hypothetical protein